eukprot:gnl/TRDRNA2_/TRDRNA2_160192_c0_seq4.p1 gnl/TRDRNA2_/TRDRNA2_160192_c0~~gnl/TRDRNA2_/TRDRNA2_160192_c0_seq4.p1  ORF type:complete len:676 (+),score=169.26 gnl/TRDRNA2_/TRDRNA2_160192_c0_seq4:185-2029(+)
MEDAIAKAEVVEAKETDDAKDEEHMQKACKSPVTKTKAPAETKITDFVVKEVDKAAEDAGEPMETGPLKEREDTQKAYESMVKETNDPHSGEVKNKVSEGKEEEKKVTTESLKYEEKHKVTLEDKKDKAHKLKAREPVVFSEEDFQDVVDKEEEKVTTAAEKDLESTTKGLEELLVWRHVGKDVGAGDEEIQALKVQSGARGSSDRGRSARGRSKVHMSGEPETITHEDTKKTQESMAQEKSVPHGGGEGNERGAEGQEVLKEVTKEAVKDKEEKEVTTEAPKDKEDTLKEKKVTTEAVEAAGEGDTGGAGTPPKSLFQTEATVEGYEKQGAYNMWTGMSTTAVARLFDQAASPQEPRQRALSRGKAFEGYTWSSWCTDGHGWATSEWQQPSSWAWNTEGSDRQARYAWWKKNQPSSSARWRPRTRSPEASAEHASRRPVPTLTEFLPPGLSAGNGPPKTVEVHSNLPNKSAHAPAPCPPGLAASRSLLRATLSALQGRWHGVDGDQEDMCYEVRLGLSTGRPGLVCSRWHIGDMHGPPSEDRIRFEGGDIYLGPSGCFYLEAITEYSVAWADVHNPGVVRTWERGWRSHRSRRDVSSEPRPRSRPQTVWAAGA